MRIRSETREWEGGGDRRWRSKNGGNGSSWVSSKSRGQLHRRFQTRSYIVFQLTVH